MPIAETGPSDWFDARSEARSVSRQRITVIAEAEIGARERLQARFIAAYGLAARRSSSR